MQKIENKEELLKITGGELTVWTCLAISAVVIFITGIITGYTYPEPCNKK